MENQNHIKTSFWNFKTPKSYSNLLEKVLDFLVGLFILDIPISLLSSKYISVVYQQLSEIDAPKYSISFFLSTLIPLFLIAILLILGVFYFWKRRKYLAYGLLISLITSLIVYILLFNLFFALN